MSPMTPRPFTFDLEFDDAGAVVAPPVLVRVITPEEVEAAREEGFARGQASVVARAETAQAQALGEIGRMLGAALSTLTALAHEHRSAAAELALAAARAIAGAALERCPEAPAEAALEALAQEVSASPRLVISAHPGQADRLRAALEQQADRIGYPGAVVFKAEPRLSPCGFSFDWGDGRAAFDPDAAFARVRAALEGALAVEGLHAEPIDLGPDLIQDAA